jgi:pseudouridine-5'-phosphate glycosidase
MGLGVQLLCTTGGGSVATPAAAPSPCSALLQELSRTSANVLHFECAGKAPKQIIFIF